MSYTGGAGHGHQFKFNKKDKYGNPIQYTGGNMGGHGHKTQAGGEYGNKGHDQGGGILHRSNSSSSSSSSSEDDGQGGRRKKSIKEKIKEKLPGGNKPTTGQDAYAHGHGATTTTPAEGCGGGYGAATTTHETYGAHGADEQPHKKGFMDKIMDKLPGHH